MSTTPPDSKSLISQIYMRSNFPTRPVDLDRLSCMTRNPDGNSLTSKDIVASARTLWEEFPVRLARRIVELERLPSKMADHPSIKTLKAKLTNSFARLLACPEPVDEASEREYMVLQQCVRDSHADMYSLLVDALVHSGNAAQSEHGEVTQIIDSFYASRIGLRMLIDHHNALKRQLRKQDSDTTGIISNINVAQLVESMADDVRSCCVDIHGTAPRIEVSGGLDFQFSYIRDHVERIMYALMLNASRATTLKQLRLAAASNGDKAVVAEDLELPPVRVFVSGDDSGATMRVSDEGDTLVHWNNTENLFKYSATASHTAPTQDARADPLAADPRAAAQSVQHVAQEAAAVHGFGLPMSRLYARYFGGDLKVIPLGRHGSDAFVYLQSLQSSRV